MKYCEVCYQKTEEDAAVCPKCGGTAFVSEEETEGLPTLQAPESGTTGEQVDPDSDETEPEPEEFSCGGQKKEEERADPQTQEAAEPTKPNVSGEFPGKTENDPAEDAAEETRAEHAEPEAKKTIGLKTAATAWIKKVAKPVWVCFAKEGESPAVSEKRRTITFLAVFAALALFTTVAGGVIRIATASPKPDEGKTEDNVYKNTYLNLRFDANMMDTYFPRPETEEAQNELKFHFEDSEHVAYTATSCYYAGIDETNEGMFLIIRDSYNVYKAETVSSVKNYLNYIYATIGFNENYDYTPYTCPISGDDGYTCEKVTNRATGYTHLFMLKNGPNNDVILLYFASANPNNISQAVGLLHTIK